MTSTLVMADMSTIAPLVEGDGVEVLGFYIGGDTPNVPQLTQVDALGTRYLLPIYTRDDPERVAVESDAQAAIKHLGLIGAPKGIAVGLDLEMAVDGQWVQDFNDILGAAGYRVIAYGSRSTLEKNPRPSAGYWDADWTGEPHLNEGSTATQYASDAMAKRPYDLSLVASDAPLWDTHAAAVTKPAPPTTAADPKVEVLQKLLNALGADLKVDGQKGPLTRGAFSVVMSRYGTIVEGNAGSAVRALQAMLNTWYDVVTLPALSVDGQFGPKTLAAVEEFQVKRAVKDSVTNGKGDGRVGPNTKAALAV